MKKIIVMFAALVFLFGAGITVQAESKEGTAVVSDLLELVKDRSSEEVDELIEFIKEKLAAGDLATDQDIQNAIEEGEEKFQVALTEEEKQKILDVMHKIKELGLDPEKLLDQAKDLYNKFGDELIGNAEQAVKQSFKDSVSDFFTDFGNRIKDFCVNLFS